MSPTASEAVWRGTACAHLLTLERFRHLGVSYPKAWLVFVLPAVVLAIAFGSCWRVFRRYRSPEACRACIDAERAAKARVVQKGIQEGSAAGCLRIHAGWVLQFGIPRTTAQQV